MLRLTILDRYLLRQFTQIYLICFVSLTGLYVIFDAFTNLDNFTSQSSSAGDLLGLMSTYYLFRVPFFFDRTSGILVLTSAMFTIAWLQRHNEFLVLLTAGVPARRVVRPLIVVACGISLLAAASRELLIPDLREPLSRSPKDLRGNAAQTLQSRYDGSSDVLFNGKATIARQQRVEEPSLLLPRGLDDYGRQLVAEAAVYQPPRGNRPGGYLLLGVVQPAGLARRPSLLKDDRPVLLTPHDFPDWLQPDQCFLVSDMTFEQLTGGVGWRQFSSTLQLVRILRGRIDDYAGDVRTTVHQRILNVLLDLTLFFLGLPLLLQSQRTSPFLAIGQCLVIVVVYVLSILGFQHLGSTGQISPALAAWLPLLIFVPVAAWLSQPLCD